MSSLPPKVQQTYAGATQEATSRLFAADVARAAESGYHVFSQDWQGLSLTVVYELDAGRDAAPMAPSTVGVAAPIPSPAPSPAPMPTQQPQAYPPVPPAPVPTPMAAPAPQAYAGQPGAAAAYPVVPPQSPGMVFAAPGFAAGVGAGLAKANWTPANIAIVVGGILLALGTFLPWASVSVLGITQTVSGTQGADGLFALLLGVVIAICGVAIAMGRWPILRQVAIVLSLIAVVFILYEIVDINSKLSEVSGLTDGLGDPTGVLGTDPGSGTGLGAGLLGGLQGSISASIGFGLIIALLGTVIAAVGSSLATLRGLIAARR